MSESLLGIDPFQNKIRVDQSDRREHMYLLGASGTGKSTLLTSLILEDIKQGLGVAVLEPHGSLIENVLKGMQTLKNPRYNDVIYLDITSNHVWGMNLFQCSDLNDIFAVENTINQVMTLLTKVYDITPQTPHMWQFFLNITQTFIYNPPYGFLDVPRLFSDKAFTLGLVANVPNAQVQWFWKNFFENKSRHQQTEDYNSIVNKLDEFFRPVLKTIFGQQTSTIDLRKIMDERKILLCRLNARWESLTKITGSALVAAILDAAYSRQNIAQNKRKQFNAYFDEFQWFESQLFAQLFSEARKWGLSCTVSHQVLEQVEDPSILATCQQAKTIISYRVSGKNGDDLANNFDTTPIHMETRRESVLAYKQDVLGHLLHQGHKSEEVNEFAKYLPELFDAVKQQIDKSPMGLRVTKLDYVKYPHVAFPEGDVYAFDPDEIRKQLMTLNSYLYNFMSHQNDGKSILELVSNSYFVPNPMLKAFSTILGFYHYYLINYEPQTQEGIKAGHKLKEIFQQDRRLMEEHTHATGKEKEEIVKKIHELRAEQDELKETLLQQGGKYLAEDLFWQATHNRPIGEKVEIYDNRLITYRFEGKPFNQNNYHEMGYDIYFREKWRCIDFQNKLWSAAINLTIYPIMVDSGQHEEKPVAQQTHADRKQEIATMLSHLPNYTAYTKTGENAQYCQNCGVNPPPSTKFCSKCGKKLKNEYMITVPPVSIPPANLPAILKNIVQQNETEGYTKLRSEVEKDIAARQQPAPPTPQVGLNNPPPVQKPQQVATPVVPQAAPIPRKRVIAAPVGKQCPDCGVQNSPTANFCQGCGKKL